jgi:hypothetical protein
MPRKKSPVTRPEIDPGTFRLVAQCLNHFATPGPRYKNNLKLKYLYKNFIWQYKETKMKLFQIVHKNLHYLHMQCAAVITHLLFTRVPPQKWPPLRVIDTSHGNSPGFADSPPTIRPSRPHCRPQGTSATEVTDLLIESMHRYLRFEEFINWNRLWQVFTSPGSQFSVMSPCHRRCLHTINGILSSTPSFVFYHESYL